jgi:hypothetical protein
MDDDVAMVEQAIEDRRGQHVVPEDLAPLGEGLVRGEDDRAAECARRLDGFRAGIPEWL